MRVDDDFGINSDGLMVTEDDNQPVQKVGIPNGTRREFARARKALQYAGSIDEYTKIMLDGNNGGYCKRLADWRPQPKRTKRSGANLSWTESLTSCGRTKDGVFGRRQRCAPIPRCSSKIPPAVRSNNRELHQWRRARLGAIAE